MKVLAVLLSLFVSVSSYAVDAKPVFKKGEFFTVTPGDEVEGSVQIVTDQKGQSFLILNKDFMAARGPNLYVVLHSEVVPQSYTDQNSIILSRLMAYEGMQVYPIPNNLNLDFFKAVIIYCLKYDVTFGSAPLK